MGPETGRGKATRRKEIARRGMTCLDRGYYSVFYSIHDEGSFSFFF
jgi:hypothetical protein